METVITTTTRQFSDLDLRFTIHPVRKDINRHLKEFAVINSIKNLVLTNHYERPFQPDIGCNVRRMLFENMDVVTSAAIQREIQLIIQNYEPRVSIIALSVTPDYDGNSYTVQLEFSVINLTTPISITFQLERLR